MQLAFTLLQVALVLLGAVVALKFFNGFLNKYGTKKNKNCCGPCPPI